jgi:hypothetical protein
MWLGHRFPGLGLSVEDVWHLTPEQTAAMVKAGNEILTEATKDHFNLHTRTLAMAAGAQIGAL